MRCDLEETVAEPEFVQLAEPALRELGIVDTGVLVAVSGGPDSVGLLRLVHTLQPALGLRLTVAHVNHRLRGHESDGDECFVRELCKGLGLPLHVHHVGVPPRRGELAARNERYAALRDAARAGGAGFVATAHTADDQAETVLHRVVRGTGIAGLRGIPPRRLLAPGLILVRPLLGLRREQVRRYLRELDQAFREDSSNREVRFTRNRLRHEILPALQALNPEVGAALCRLAQQAAEIHDVARSAVRELRQQALLESDPARVCFDAGVLAGSSGYVIRELFRETWCDQGWPLRRMGAAEWDRLASLVQSPAGACDLPDGVRARRVARMVVLERT
jgi:tRNA(Ile)-lysidine synthase